MGLRPFKYKANLCVKVLNTYAWIERHISFLHTFQNLNHKHKWVKSGIIVSEVHPSCIFFLILQVQIIKHWRKKSINIFLYIHYPSMTLGYRRVLDESESLKLCQYVADSSCGSFQHDRNGWSYHIESVLNLSVECHKRYIAIRKLDKDSHAQLGLHEEFSSSSSYSEK